MFIRCTLSLALESLADFSRQFSKLSPLPEYIIEKGPYSNNQKDGAHEITLIYEVDGSRLVQAWGEISGQLDSLRRLPGFSLSAHILKMREGKTAHLV